MTKLFRTTSSAALIALIAAAPLTATAQSATGTTDNQTNIQTPADDTNGSAAMSDDGSTMKPAGDASDTADSSSTDTSTGMSTKTADASENKAPAKPVDGQITMQDDNTILADNLIGSTVYNGQKEAVGNIDDLIISMDGKVNGVVIGVGGFLGMGEKHVAVQMASLQVQNDDAGNPRLITSATKNDLESAPAFTSKAEQKKDADSSTMMDQGASGNTSGSTATQ